jgi:CubicO group peptidase (beta-lactamase class C family)
MSLILPRAAASEIGLSQDRLDRIRPYFEKHIAANRMAGGLGLIARHGKVGYFETFGMADKESGRPIQEDTIFRIYSMTKAVTGVAAMMLFEEGAFALSDPLAAFIPEFANMQVAVEKADPATGKSVLTHTVPAKRQITILDLMRHTAGFNYAGPRDENGDLFYNKLGLQMAGGEFTCAELASRLANAPLVNEPGTVWDYGFGTDILGRFVEVVSGQPLDEFFGQRILKPLGMNETGFYVKEANWDRFATLYQPTADGTIRRSTGPLQDGYRTKPTLLLGGAGLTSTVSDYLRFVTMLLNGGELNGVRLLSPRTVELMRSDCLGNLPSIGPLLPAGHGFGLTFAVCKGQGRSATLGSKGMYRWGGAAGTSFWIDPKKQLIGLFMMQSMLDLVKRAYFQQLAYQALTD